jgi:hypothetical protein
MNLNVRRLFVVSRHSLTLASYLRAWFEADVDVILDRRHGERRWPGVYGGSERRRGGRRIRPEIDAEIKLTSYALVVLPN